MICIRGDEQQFVDLPEVARLGAGIELGSYGLIGIRSQRDWNERVSQHQAVVSAFAGKVALHGPFIGMQYAHSDCLIRAAIEKRLDLTFQAAVRLSAFRVVLHSGFHSDIESFGLQDDWLARNVQFWKSEIARWRESRIDIALENDTERTPDLLIRLVEGVDDPALGLCLDTGHLHFFSKLPPQDWIRAMAKHIRHYHLHDNDRNADRHWPIGKGTLDSVSLFAAIEAETPDATLSVEVEDTMEVKMDQLEGLRGRFGGQMKPG